MKPPLRVAEPNALFTPTPEQVALRSAMRECVANGEIFIAAWIARARTARRSERVEVTVGDYDRWNKSPAFAAWFGEEMVREKSAFELAMEQQQAERVIDTQVKKGSESAAKYVLGKTTKSGKPGDQKEADAAAQEQAAAAVRARMHKTG